MHCRLFLVFGLLAAGCLNPLGEDPSASRGYSEAPSGSAPDGLGSESAGDMAVGGVTDGVDAEDVAPPEAPDAGAVDSPDADPEPDDTDAGAERDAGVPAPPSEIDP